MQLVVHLLLLELNLLFVGQVLPFATSTHSEMFAEWGRAYITIFSDSHYFALGKGVLLSANLHIANVARHTEGYKHHQVVPVEQALTLGSHGLDFYTLK